MLITTPEWYISSPRTTYKVQLTGLTTQQKKYESTFNFSSEKFFCIPFIIFTAASVFSLQLVRLSSRSVLFLARASPIAEHASRPRPFQDKFNTARPRFSCRRQSQITKTHKARVTFYQVLIMFLFHWMNQIFWTKRRRLLIKSTLRPFPIATAPFPRMWFQLASRISNVSLLAKMQNVIFPINIMSFKLKLESFA